MLREYMLYQQIITGMKDNQSAVHVFRGRFIIEKLFEFT